MAQSQQSVSRWAGAPPSVDDSDTTLIPRGKTIFQALEERGLISTSGWSETIGKHLVPAGHLGTISDAGKFLFLKPGYYTFMNPRVHYHGSIPVTNQFIFLGDPKDGALQSNAVVSIITVPQGNLGLSHRSGVTKVLHPGVHILETPHHFEAIKNANERYINLGTYHRILVSANEVAIAFDGKNTILIGHDQVFRVSEEILPNGKHKLVDVSAQYKQSGVFEIINNTFMFDPNNGFKSLQVIEKEIDDLRFSTGDSSYSGTVWAIVRYRITDAYDAFVAVQDVHADVLKQARATLGDILRRLTVDQMTLVPPPTVGLSQGNNNDPLAPNQSNNESYAQWVAAQFHRELERVVSRWGVSDISVRIERMEPSAETKRNLEARAKLRMEASTQAQLLQTQTATALANAQRDQQIMISNADAAARVRVAQAEGEAKSKIARAEGHGKTVTILATADANAIALKAKAEYEASLLRASAYKTMGLTPDLITLMELNRINTEKSKVLAAAGNTLIVPNDFEMGSQSTISHLTTQLKDLHTAAK